MNKRFQVWYRRRWTEWILWSEFDGLRMRDRAVRRLAKIHTGRSWGTSDYGEPVVLWRHKK
jgi:hypothetical protein